MTEILADNVIAAAARMGICRAQLYKEISKGTLVARKLGRRTLIERAEQARWMTSLPVKAVAS